MSVREGHEIAHLVKDRLLHSDLRILDALVHVEPNPDSDSDSDAQADPGEGRVLTPGTVAPPDGPEL